MSPSYSCQPGLRLEIRVIMKFHNKGWWTGVNQTTNTLALQAHLFKANYLEQMTINRRVRSWDRTRSLLVLVHEANILTETPPVKSKKIREDIFELLAPTWTDRSDKSSRAPLSSFLVHHLSPWGLESRSLLVYWIRTNCHFKPSSPSLRLLPTNWSCYEPVFLARAEL